MDEQSPTPQITDPETPAPDPPAPEAQARAARRGRVRRWLATTTATALVAGGAGISAGYAVGQGLRSSQATTNMSGGDAAVGSAGVTSPPGSGLDGRWLDGGQGGTTSPNLPFDGADGGWSASGSSGPSSTRATGSQLTGLVRIVSTLTYEGGTAAGTGMVLTSDGEVVTNHHVVAGATSVKVTVMSTGRSYRATVVGSDAADDVAVLRLVGASGLETVTPDTDGVRVGDAVTAVGDANGAVDGLTAAAGEVTALRRSITTAGEGAASGERLTGLIEISSDVVSGDSGGATYDENGQVVGMTTAASSGMGDIVGYAVPIGKVLRIVRDLDSGVSSSRYDYTRPAFLGVALGNLSATVLGVYGGTPAAAAGLTAGDRITAVDSTRVSTSAQLRRAVGAHAPGDSVSLSWTDADGTSHTATTRLAEGPVE